MEQGALEKPTLKSTILRLSSWLRSSSEETDERYMLQDTTLETAPVQFEKLFSHFKVEKLSKSEILFQLVYLVALETGFCEKNAFAQCASALRFSYVVPSFFDWHNVNCLVQHQPIFNCDSNGTKFTMQLRNIISDQMLANADVDVTTVCMNLSAIVTGDLMIVSLVPARVDEILCQHCERSACLTVPRYFVGTIGKKSKLNENLRNLKELVIELREKIFVPVRTYQFSLLELDSYPSLLGLPREVYEIVFDYLDDRQLCNLATVNKFLNNMIVNSKQYQKRIIEKEVPFPVILEKKSNSSLFGMEPYY